MIDLYITAGEIGSEFTKLVLGPNADRAVIGGYPKADELIRFNTERNRNAVFKELGFDTLKPLITYAPAAEESYKKPGGSLSPTVLKELQKLASENSYNILVKLKYPQDSLLNRGIKLIKRIILTKRR